MSLLSDLWIILGTVYWLKIYMLNTDKYNNTNEYTVIDRSLQLVVDRSLQLVFFPVTGVVCALNYILFGNLDFLK